jgi:hypothetical protein
MVLLFKRQRPGGNVQVGKQVYPVHLSPSGTLCIGLCKEVARAEIKGCGAQPMIIESSLGCTIQPGCTRYHTQASVEASVGAPCRLTAQFMSAVSAGPARGCRNQSQRVRNVPGARCSRRSRRPDKMIFTRAPPRRGEQGLGLRPVLARNQR